MTQQCFHNLRMVRADGQIDRPVPIAIAGTALRAMI